MPRRCDDFLGVGGEGCDDVGDLFGGLRVGGDQGSGDEGGEKDSGDSTQRGDDSQVRLLWILSGFVSGYFERRDLPVKANRGSLTHFALLVDKERRWIVGWETN